MRPLGYAIFGLLAYLGLVAAACRLLWRSLPAGAGWLAGVLFAVAPTHFQPVGWIAAHNALLTAALGTTALLCHLRWRRDGWRAGSVASPFFFAAALLAGEAALGAFAYLVAYELIGAEGSPGHRLASILPHGVITVLWLGAYQWLGYGAYGCGVYINPIDEPLRYLGMLPEGMLASAGVLFGGVPADFWMLTSLRPSMVVAGVVTLAVVVPLTYGSLRRLQPAERKGVSWLLIEMGGALMPQMAGLLGSRSYVLPTVGGSALLAVILHHWWTFVRSMPGLRQRLWAAASVLLAVIHLPLAAASWFAWSEIYSHLFRQNDRIISAMELDPERIRAERVVVLTSPNIFTAVYPPFQRVAQDQPLPETWWVLSLARCDHRLHRRGPDTLELELVDGQMMTTPFETLFRDDESRLRAGDMVELTGFRVTVISVADRGPTRISFQFDRPLNDPSLRFIAWRDGRMGRVEIPAVGESLLLRWQGANAPRRRRARCGQRGEGPGRPRHL